MIRFVLSLFRRRPVVVQTFKTQKTDFEKRREEKCQQLAKELGRDWRHV
jgi:hypothetical protein